LALRRLAGGAGFRGAPNTQAALGQQAACTCAEHARAQPATKPPTHAASAAHANARRPTERGKVNDRGSSRLPPPTTHGKRAPHKRVDATHKPAARDGGRHAPQPPEQKQRGPSHRMNAMGVHAASDPHARLHAGREAEGKADDRGFPCPAPPNPHPADSARRPADPRQRKSRPRCGCASHRPEGADGHAGPHGRPAPLPGKQQRDSSHCIKAMKVKHPRNAPKAGPDRNPRQEPTDRPQRPIPSPLARNRPP
jgi:hypothetical protein